MTNTSHGGTFHTSERNGPSSSDSEKSASETIKSAVSGLADTASKTASDLTSAASKTGSAVAEQATGLVAGATEVLKTQASSIKSSGADAVSGLASSARDLATNIENQSPQIAGLVRSAADGADTLSHQLRDQDFAELLNSMTNFARKRPAIAVGVGVLAGFVLSRMLRSVKDA